MKKLFLLTLSFVFAMLIVSCGDGGDEKNDDTNVPDDATDNVVKDDAAVVTDEATDELLDDDVVAPCKLEDTFFDAMPAEWTAYFTMKMSGLINDPANADPDFAFLTKINAKLLGTDYNLGDLYGMYQLDSVTLTDGSTMPAVIVVGVGNRTDPVANKLVSIWAGQTFAVVDDLLNWKTQADTAGETGASITGTYQIAIFEVWLEVSTTGQLTRMECMRGLSALNETADAYDGGMFVCTDTNTEWAIGEQMKMMDYSKMVDDPTELLTVMNEGLETSDPNYRTDVCRCFTKDVDASGNPTTIMDCEDMKDEFGVGELPDEEADTIVSDEDVILTD